MKFVFDLLNRESDFIKKAFLNISKYSQGEIFITDEKFNILFRNSYESSGQNFLNLDENIVNQDFKNHIKTFEKSEKNHLFIKMIFNTDGNFNSLPVDVHICKIKNKRNVLKGFAIIIQDITDEIENRIQRQTFVDILSHDLRNPLRANIQILELILKDKFGETNNRLKFMLEELLNSCKFMNYMAENLVIRYKNEFNMYELLKEPYSVVKLVKDTYNSLSPMLDKRRQSVELTVNGKENNTNIDVDSMEKVIKSLIINASEYNPDGISIRIQIENTKNATNITFFNCGNNTNAGDDIFEKYITCSNRFRKIGFSLELYNCKRIIEAHNGIISAKNLGIEGMQIKIQLPVV